MLPHHHHIPFPAACSPPAALLKHRYLSLHFGPFEVAFADFLAETGLLADSLDFPKKCGDLVMHWARKQGAATARAIDLGCAVGR